MEEVFYIADKSNPDLVYDGFLIRDKILKQFCLFTYSNKNSEIVNLCIEEDNIDIEVKSNESLLDAIFTVSPMFNDRPNEKDYYTIIKSNHKVGIINPRIYRPFLNDPNSLNTFPSLGNAIFNKDIIVKKNVYPPYNKNELISSINQLHVLIENLKSIFLTIHPENDNLKAYGHNIRNLLILACTEVEAQFKGVLKQNGYNFNKSPRTEDFFELKNPLKLDGYSVKLINYPWLEPISPFKDWKKDKPTGSLTWYDNYNAVKHDRVTEFHKGTLKDVIDATSAIAILLIAQYGYDIIMDQSQINNHFEFYHLTGWTISDYYIPPHRESEWVEEKLF